MKRSDKCSTCCYFFSPESGEIDSPGWCDILGDCGCQGAAQTRWNWICMFAEGKYPYKVDPSVTKGPPKEMVEETKREKENFKKSLDKATKIVNSWPEWKQKMIRNIFNCLILFVSIIVLSSCGGIDENSQPICIKELKTNFIELEPSCNYMIKFKDPITVTKKTYGNNCSGLYYVYIISTNQEEKFTIMETFFENFIDYNGEKIMTKQTPIEKENLK